MYLESRVCGMGHSDQAGIPKLSKRGATSKRKVDKRLKNYDLLCQQRTELIVNLTLLVTDSVKNLHFFKPSTSKRKIP